MLQTFSTVGPCCSRSCKRPQLQPLGHPTANARRIRRTCRHAAALPPGLDSTLLVESTLPVLKVGMISAAGAAAAHYGMLNAEARRALSKLAINVFTPALMITKIGAHTDLASALNLWYIGANVILCHFVGLGLGILHTRLLPTPPDLKHIIQVSSAIANTGNLPLVLVLSLIKSPSLPFNTAAQADMAVSYIMLGLGYATLVQMPLGTLLLHKPRQQVADAAAAVTADSSSNVSLVNNVITFGSAASLQALAADPAAAVTTQQQAVGAMQATRAGHVATLDRPLSRAASLMSLELQMQSSTAVQQWEHASRIGTTMRTSTTTAATISSTAHGSGVSTRTASSTAFLQPTQQQQTVPSRLLPLQLNQQQMGQQYPTLPQQQQQQQVMQQPLEALQGLKVQMQQWVEQCFGSWWQQHGDVMEPLVKGVLSPPLIGGVLAIMIGSCPPLQAALFRPRGSLSVVADVLEMLGQPLIPILLLVLGANLANGPQLANGAHLPPLNVAGVIASKLILSPLIGLAVVLSAQKLGLLGVAPDPLAVLVMMVSWSTPTAILVHSLALVHKNGEDEVSALLFYEYLAAALTLPLCSTLYLYVLGCCMPQVA